MEEDRMFTKNLFISFLIVFVFMIFWQKYIGKNMQKQNVTGKAQTHDSTPISAATLKDGVPSLAGGSDTISVTDTLWDSKLLEIKAQNMNVKLAKLGSFYDVYLKKYNTHLLDTTFARYFFTGYRAYEYGDSVVELTRGKRLVLFSRDSLEIKAFTFNPDSYLVEFSVERKDSTPVYVEFYGDLYLDPFNLKEENRIYSFVLKTKKGYKKYQITKLLKKPRDIEIPFEDVKFIGLKNKYFMFVVVNRNGEKGKLKFGIKEGTPYFRIESENNNLNLLAYSGPIDYFLLKKIGYGLFANYDFGSVIVAPFSMAILYILRFLHKFIPNWGWAIVVFALLMKIVFFPLTYKSLSSTRKMQKLKPEIDKLQKIYKDDPQKLQQEMMELYKKHNMNPFSGCLMLVVQLPVFWALYRILRMTIELRGAEFIFWIKDLSVKDPYYILPILMGITSIIQTKLQQSDVQDSQTRMFTYFMPIFLVIIFISMPSGIVLYWFTYNLFSVFETLLIKRLEVS